MAPAAARAQRPGEPWPGGTPCEQVAASDWPKGRKGGSGRGPCPGEPLRGTEDGAEAPSGDGRRRRRGLGKMVGENKNKRGKGGKEGRGRERRGKEGRGGWDGGTDR